MKLLLTWQATDEEISLIRQYVPEDLEIITPPARSYVGRRECDLSDLMELSKEADVLMGWIPFPRDILLNAKKLKFISWLHAGCDQLDLYTLRSLNIKVSNVSGTNSIAVAEHAFAFLLALAKRILDNHRIVADVKWFHSRDPRYSSIELFGKTIVIVGLGRIGSEVAKRARAFGVRVIGIDPRLPEGVADEVFLPENIRDALPKADFVVLTVPLTSKTRRIIGEAELKSMRNSAYLINVARGELVHEAPLAIALKEGWIAGYAADVWWEYPYVMPSGYHFPVPSREGINRMPNVVASGDKASNVPEVKDRMIKLGAENVGAFVRSEVPPRLVDLDLEF